MRVFVCTCVVRSDQGGSRKNKKDCSGHRLKRGRLRSLGERTADWKIRHACEGQEVLVNLQVRRSNSHVLKPLSATFLPTTPSLFFRTSASTALWRQRSKFVSNHLWYLYTCTHRCIPVVPFKVFIVGKQWNKIHCLCYSSVLSASSSFVADCVLRCWWSTRCEHRQWILFHCFLTGRHVT